MKNRLFTQPQIALAEEMASSTLLAIGSGGRIVFAGGVKSTGGYDIRDSNIDTR